MNNIEILEEFIDEFRKDNVIVSIKGIRREKEYQAIENLIQENKELKEKLEEKDMQHELELIGKEEYTKDAMGEIIEHYYTANEDCIPKSKVKEKIEETNKRIDYLDKELVEAYIQREKLGTETELDANEQYIYNMEQERSVRHTEKYAYLKLLEEE